MMLPICREIREDILKVSKASKQGHIPTSFSIVEILYAVYTAIKNDPANPSWQERDIFILSKGHGALAHYCVLAELNYFPKDGLCFFGAFMSKYGCHADRCKVPGIEVSSGSLGHGIGIAVGMALALKLKKSSRRVFVLVGDGEANEGSVWEAIMAAVSLKLDNLTVIFDYNRSQIRGLQIDNPVERFISFGCESLLVDGHNVRSLKTQISKKSDKVKVIVAETQKGFGCKTLIENQWEWHRKSPTDEEFGNLVKELNEKAV